MSVETIVVEKNGKFGPMVNGVYYSFSKFFKGEKEFNVGESVRVDVFTSESGKKYINAVIPTSNAEMNQEMAGQVVAKENSKPVIQTTDWAAKDRSQLVGGRSHDAAQLVNVSLVTGTPMKDVLELYQEALEGVLKISQEVK